MNTKASITKAYELAADDNFFNKEGNEQTFYYFKVDELKSLVEGLGF